MKPLDSTTEEQTLMLMDMWVWGHKVSAAKRYNEIIVSKVKQTFINPNFAETDMRRITTSYEILNDYFKSF